MPLFTLLAYLLVVLPQVERPTDLSSSTRDDPSQEVVAVAAEGDWVGDLVLDRGDVGVWTVKSFQVFDQYAGPQAVGLDDRGRCWVLVCYSGKWTPFPILEEGEWLGAAAHGDLDPRAAGQELYVAGKRGNVYQVRSYRAGVIDARLIASFPGEEVHALAFVGGETPALLAFTSPGLVRRLTPTAQHGEFEAHAPLEFSRMKGRVRDALTLENGTVAVVSRTGELALAPRRRRERRPAGLASLARREGPCRARSRLSGPQGALHHTGRRRDPAPRTTRLHGRHRS